MKRWLLVLGVAAQAACSSSGSDCSTDDDCFQAEICTEGACVQGVRVNNINNDNHANNTSPADAGLDTHLPDLSNPPDQDSPDQDTNDLGTEPDASPQACTVDRLQSTCADDAYEPNNSWIDGKKLNTGFAGCPTTSEFVGLDQTINAQKCARDDEDWFYVDFFPCTENDIELRWTLEFTDMCADTLFDFDSLSFACGTEATCTSVEGGAEIAIVVPKTGLRQSQLSYVAVKSLSPNFQAAYTLRVQVIQR